MNNFIIKQIDKDYAKYLVFGTTVDSPLFQLTEIKKAINIMNGDKIIFDQLLQTGNIESRFLIMTFANNNFDYESAKNVDTKIIDIDTRAFGCTYLRNNRLLLKYSILLSDQKEMILNGGTI